jgi:hypothetical protein
MKRLPVIAACFAFAGSPALSAGPAAALGTVRIQQSDGAVKTYTGVRVRIQDESMQLTTSDGQGTLVIGKAACTQVGRLVRCFPYDATLEQNGGATHIPLVSGTVWLNRSTAPQRLSHSTTQIPPHGVLMAIQTKVGTYVTLSGTVDSIAK